MSSPGIAVRSIAWNWASGMWRLPDRRCFFAIVSLALIAGQNPHATENRGEPAESAPAEADKSPLEEPLKRKSEAIEPSDIRELTQAIRVQMQALERLKSQNEELARTNLDLVRRIRALEEKSAPASQSLAKDAEVRNVVDKASGPSDDRPLAGSPPVSPSTAGQLPVMPGEVTHIDTVPHPDVVVESVPADPGFSPPELTIPSSPALSQFPDQSAGAAMAIPGSAAGGDAQGPPVIQPLPKSDLGPSPGAVGQMPGDFLLGRYDNGFVIVAPKNPNKTPFAAKLNIVTQERYTGFASQVDQWQPRNLRTPIAVDNRSTFDVNRAYIGFSGFAIDPRLRYSMIVATTSAVNVTYLLGVIGFQFTKEFGLYGGFNKVPGSREWLESFKNTLGVDRSMATTFFRPSMSPGVWITGEPLPDMHYYGMISNAMNSLDQLGDRRSTQMCYAGSVWWEPLGSFGPGFSDEEFHESPALRFGGSGLFTRQDREPLLGSLLENPENTVLRLSDGIPIFAPGALAPGVNLLATDDRMISVDSGLKYRGFSLSGEWYFRWLNNFRTDRSLPGLKSVYDSGGYLQTSYALVPRKLEIYAKTSLVAGPFGSGDEYGGGANWYVRGSRNWRMSAEAMQVNRSPAYNVLTPYRIGQSGTIVMLQMVTDF